MAGSRVTTTLAAVLSATRDRLVAQSVFARSCCELTTDPEVMLAAAAGDRLAGIELADRMQLEDTVTTDASTTEVMVEGDLVVTAFLRLRLDRAGQADALITDPVLGLAELERSILLALHNHELLDAAADFILARSLTYKTTAKRTPAAEGWAGLDLHFNVCFTWNLAA